MHYLEVTKSWLLHGFTQYLKTMLVQLQVNHVLCLLQIVAAEGEQKASRALKEAADVMMESPAAIQLRYLQTLNSIAAERNSTIIFPLPIDVMSTFMKK